MSKSEIEKRTSLAEIASRLSASRRVKKLRNEISRLRDAYHIENAPNVTDDVYDSLTRELRTLLEEYPEFKDASSPLNRIAGKPLQKFKKIKHKIRMLSLNDVFNPEELYEWEKRIKKLLPPSPLQGEGQRGEVNYFCEIKFDGLAGSLIYEKGIFKTGATRGDSFIGEDITLNLKTISSIPLVLPKPCPDYLEVRGEALMSKKTLSFLNKINERIGKPLFANTRNATAGSLRQLDAKLVAERHLDFYAYDIAQISNDEKIKNHSEKHKYLKELGFNVGESDAVCKDLTEAFRFIEKFEIERPKFPFGTDGIVVSIDNLEFQEILGVVGKAPRYMVAYKYPAERATTIIKDVKINVGRTGVLTPLAIFSPTLVAGSTVSKATLHNMDQIERLDLRIGDTVVIEKAGDVIPKVVEVLTRMRTGKEKKFKMPEKCPVCGGKIERRGISGGKRSGLGNSERPDLEEPASVAFYCANSKCPAKNERFLDHFVSVFEIYELGPKNLRRFKDEGLISDAADIFTLEKEDIQVLERFGEKSAENIVNEIRSKKKVSFARFLWALGILHVGEETARDLAIHFGTLENLIKADLTQIDEIENIGPAVSQSLHEFFRDKNNLEFIKKLEKNGVVIEKAKAQTRGKFSGLTFVLTGALSQMSREIAKEKIISLGGKVAGAVSKNTSYVVAGEESGSKEKTALKLGVKILNEKEFLKLLL